MKKCLPFLLFVSVIVLSSCSKDVESEGDASALFGDWKFTGMKAKTLADITISSGGTSDRTVSTSEYTTTNNAGLLRFSADKAQSIDFAYKASGNMLAKVYTNGVFDYETTVPFSQTLPKSGSSSGYKAVGTDSLYLTGGLISMPDASGGQTPVVAQGSGMKYKIAGTKLTITTNVSAVANNTASGLIVKTISSVAAEMTYEKQ
jgi:hypothetical protein